MRWLSEFQAAYPDNAELVVSGNSIEGRPITGIHIWGAGGKGTKPAAVFYGTMHSREWITTMVGFVAVCPVLSTLLIEFCMKRWSSTSPKTLPPATRRTQQSKPL
jgi:murein tripeptide amidase MpaA